MEIWSKLLPEMVDINPREVLILNPIQNKVYGFNSKDNILSGSDVEIDKSQNGVFNIILNAISAGEMYLFSPLSNWEIRNRNTHPSIVNNGSQINPW